MTTFSTFLLAPLLVLPIVLLFRFVGCGLVFDFDEFDTSYPIPPEKQPVPKYRDYILGNPGKGNVRNPEFVPDGGAVIAYWRLVDDSPESAAFGSDEKRFAPGQVREGHALPNVDPTPDAPGSEPRNPASFFRGEDSLIASDPTVHCRIFDGAYVVVPHVPNLFTTQFTIEAWVRVGTLTEGYEHALFDAYPADPSDPPLGFRIVADRTNSWQVYLAPRETGLLPHPPSISVNSSTHIALTVRDKTPGSTEKSVAFYLNGKMVGTPIEVPSYAPPNGAPLFIGVERTRLFPSPADPVLLHPALFRIQEVVLHSKFLTQPELFNHVDINRKGITS
ncbi:MAG: hypothetical protein C0484_10550 [Rhodospirillum sp.]|jgi:hypothetical protein|nr:hypothetical protein [Rhodospirillum sp.]